MIPKTPTLSASPYNATVERGTTLTVTCATAGTGGSVTYNFLKNGHAIASQSSGTYTVECRGSGTYTWACTVTINSVTSAASPGHTTTVVGECMNKICSY